MEQMRVRMDVAEREIKEMKELLSDFSHKLSVVETRTTVNETDIVYIKDKLGKIEANTTWILRIIIGALLTGLISAIFAGAFIF